MSSRDVADALGINQSTVIKARQKLPDAKASPDDRPTVDKPPKGTLWDDQNDRDEEDDTIEKSQRNAVKIDQTQKRQGVHDVIMAKPSMQLSEREFASLSLIGSIGPRDRAGVIPAEHASRLIGLGYVADLQGRLRMTTPGRVLIARGNVLRRGRKTSAGRAQMH
jgi:hypothetical protein